MRHFVKLPDGQIVNPDTVEAVARDINDPKRVIVRTSNCPHLYVTATDTVEKLLEDIFNALRPSFTCGSTK